MITARHQLLRHIELACLSTIVLAMTGCALFQPGPEIPIEPLTHEFTVVTAQPGDSFSSLAEKHLRNPSLGWIIEEVNGVDALNPGQVLIIPLYPLERGGITPRGYQTVPILTYHKFSETSTDVVTVTRKAFEDQMRFLKNHGYRIISLDEFFDFLELKEPIPRKSIVITIDDGWRSAYDIAFPILKRYGYPVTLFVYTDFITDSGKTMNWAILREMAKGGVSIQCHTKTHRYLDRRIGRETFAQYFESIKKELAESAVIIRRHLGTEVKYLAYPYGETNDVVIALLEKLGYRGALTVERESNPCFVNRYRVNRSMVYGNFDLEDFANNLKVFNNQALQ